MYSRIKSFFSAAEGSIKGFVSLEELFRSIVTALGSGSIVGVLMILVQAILSHVEVIFPNPATSAMATMTLTLILDLLRRMNHGVAPSLRPSPTPAASV